MTANEIQLLWKIFGIKVLQPCNMLKLNEIGVNDDFNSMAEIHAFETTNSFPLQ